MKSFSKLMSVAVMAIAAVSFGSAFAAPAKSNSFYGDVKVGYGKVNGTINGSTSHDKKGGVYGLDAGYKFNRSVAAELGYLHFSKVKGSASNIKDNTVVYLAAKGIMPVAKNVDAFGKLGIARNHSNRPTGDNNAGKHSKYVPYLGLGVEGPISKDVKWTVGIDHAMKKGAVPAKTALTVGLGF